MNRQHRMYQRTRTDVTGSELISLSILYYEFHQLLFAGRAMAPLTSRRSRRSTTLRDDVDIRVQEICERHAHIRGMLISLSILYQPFINYSLQDIGGNLPGSQGQSTS